jgi:isopenicillin N synthase-like dioxygenase
MPATPPVVDLQPWFHGNSQQRAELCREVGALCHRIGFFYITNHGIPHQVSETYLQALKAFFALPLAAREAIDKHGSAQFRGWEKLGSELTNNLVDYREQLDIGVEAEALAEPDPYYMALIGPNQWPRETELPGFRATVNDYFARLSELARQLLGIMSCSLGLDENHIQQVFGENPSPYLKLIRYPRTRAGGQGVGVHKDSQLVTHNYFIATPHRVINQADQLRYSSAFFYSPDLNTALDPLPIDVRFIEQARRSERHRGEGLMASRAEMAAGMGGMKSLLRPRVFGDKYWQRWVRSYPDIAAKFYPGLDE